MLQTKLVVVVGVGTVGSQMARELANSAVGRLRLIDGDDLESHNVPRHALRRQYVGMNKAEALALQLSENVATLHVEALSRDLDESVSDDEIDQLLADADLIVVATDNRQAQRRIGRRALSLDLPAVFPGLYSDRGGEVFVQLSPADACFFCWDAFRRGNEQLRAVAALNVEGFAVLQLAVHLSLGLLDPRSDFARLLARSPDDDRPPQIFVQRPFAALSPASVPLRPNCPSCAVGPPGGQPHREEAVMAPWATPSSAPDPTTRAPVNVVGIVGTGLGGFMIAMFPILLIAGVIYQAIGLLAGGPTPGDRFVRAKVPASVRSGCTQRGKEPGNDADSYFFVCQGSEVTAKNISWATFQFFPPGYDWSNTAWNGEIIKSDEFCAGNWIPRNFTVVGVEGSYLARCPRQNKVGWGIGQKYFATARGRGAESLARKMLGPGKLYPCFDGQQTLC